MTSRDLQSVDLNLMVAFDALMSERSVTRAAERMQVGQPAMSASLARLRKLFDDPLLVREGRTLVPTPVAESLIGPIQQSLALMENALGQRRAFDPTREHRTFTIVASDYVLLVFLRPLLAHLRREAPAVSIHVRPVTEDYAEFLQRGRFDLLIAPRELQPSGVPLNSEDLFGDRLVCAVDSENTEVGDALTAEEFLTLPYLGYEGHAVQTVARLQMRAMGMDRPVDVSTQSFSAASLFLRDTPFFTVISERLAYCLAPQARIRLVEPPMTFAPLTETMFWSARHDDNPSHRWLRQRMRDAAEALNYQQQ
ncbi:Nodulation protein D 1 [Rhodococcus sp. RD6.2]|uniref:LysR family transcriptional regulator n=1 Tax=Rhodococcus sp. RD6.2 TaxID=260936 RepID=UPI00063BAD99|nr:LysR family transcriptional regulator [Rhodococcus sp. RD6.2]CRK49783.1 Nodulation protein D 1 [Rhodococcus sp. RD6.2]